MSKKAFRAESGLDSGGYNVQNVAYPRTGILTDGLNVQFFIDKNTVQPFSATRAYDAQFAVHYAQRVWIAKVAVAAGPFNSTQWEPLRTDPSWKVFTGTPTAAQGGQVLASGDYVSAYSTNAELDFTLPANPVVGDTIVIQDEGKYCHMRYIRVTSTSAPIEGKSVEHFTIPGSMKFFVYSSTGGGRWVVHTSVDRIKTIIANGGTSSPVQMSAGSNVYRKSSLGHVTIQLPKYAVNGDIVSTFDLDDMTAVNGATLQVEPTSGHSIENVGVSSVTSYTAGQGVFLFQNNIWTIYDGDIRSRWTTITSNYIARPMDYISVIGGSGTITITLPLHAEDGDRIKVSNVHRIDGLGLAFKVADNSGHKIVGGTANFAYPKFGNLPTSFANYPLNDSVTFTNLNYGAHVEFFYVARNDYWVLATLNLRQEHVDENNRDRPGVAPLASQTEVNKNHESSPRDDMIVTPKTLANKTATETRRGIARLATSAEMQVITSGTHLDDVIVTPLKLNSRQATETIRGVAEVATQAETNTNSNDTHIITPKKFDGRRATLSLAGTVKLVSGTSTDSVAGASRSVAGTGVYNWSDAAHNEPFVITAKTLNLAQATETSRGVGYVSTQTEANAAAGSADDVTFITPKKLSNRTATETRTGILRVATQTEANDMTVSSSDVLIITPKKLSARKATESLTGIAELATQGELDGGSDAERIIVPSKFKTWMAYEHFTSTTASGIAHSGDLWSGVTLNIVSATETQRGTLRVATQTETNAGTSDALYITPKKFNDRLSTETLRGIVEIATQAEVDAESLHNPYVVTPKTLAAYIHSASSSRSTEALAGTVRTATLAETWVGTAAGGSTGAYTTYNHVPYVVTPRTLNYALQNYLPKTAKAVDSDLLDGLDSLQFLRRDQNHDSTGVITANGFRSSNVNAYLASSGTLGLYLNTTDGRTILSGSNTASGTVIIRPLGIGSTVANTTFNSDGTVVLSSDPTAGTHAVRQSWVTTNYYNRTEADTAFVNAVGDTMTGALTISMSTPDLILTNTASSSKVWRLTGSGTSLLVREATTTRMTMAAGGATTFTSTVQSTGFKIGSTTVIESDALINWDKLKSIPASTTTLAGIVQLNNTLDSTSQVQAATANTVRILKELIDTKAGIEGAVMNDLKIMNWIRIGNVIIKPNPANKTVDFIWTDDPM